MIKIWGTYSGHHPIWWINGPEWHDLLTNFRLFFTLNPFNVLVHWHFMYIFNLWQWSLLSETRGWSLFVRKQSIIPVRLGALSEEHGRRTYYVLEQIIVNKYCVKMSNPMLDYLLSISCIQNIRHFCHAK